MGNLATAAKAQQLKPSGKKGVIEYKAKDGTDVRITPSTVLRYCVNGASDLPDKEVYRFMALCRARGLNPLTGDVHLAVFKGRATVMVSRDFHRINAQGKPTYKGLKEGCIVMDQGGEIQYRDGEFFLPTDTLLGGWCKVFDERFPEPVFSAVRLEEYHQHNSMWDAKPATMIVKVAEAHALREAYTADFGGTYTSDEIAAGIPEDAEDDTPEPVTAEVEPIEGVDMETGEVIADEEEA
jgi:phage recombination protein Bet